MFCFIVPLSLGFLLIGWWRWKTNYSIWIPLETVLAACPLLFGAAILLSGYATRSGWMDQCLDGFGILMLLAAAGIHAARAYFGFRLEREGERAPITGRYALNRWGRRTDNPNPAYAPHWSIIYEYVPGYAGRTEFTRKHWLAREVLSLPGRPRIHRIIPGEESSP